MSRSAHPAGPRHADVLAPEHLGLPPADLNALAPHVWPATARRLDAPVHTPLLVFRRVSSAAGRPVEYVVSRYRGDRYQVHMSLGANEVAAKESTSNPRSRTSTRRDPS